MPMNGTSLGRDVVIDMITPYGAIQIDPTYITNFVATPVTNNDTRKGLDGVPRQMVIPNGYTGSLTVDRADSALDDWWAQFEADYYAGKMTPTSTITETISNPDGSVSVYRYTGVAWDMKSLGERRSDQVISMSLDFMAAKRIKVA